MVMDRLRGVGESWPPFQKGNPLDRAALTLMPSWYQHLPGVNKDNVVAPYWTEDVHREIYGDGLRNAGEGKGLSQTLVDMGILPGVNTPAGQMMQGARLYGQDGPVWDASSAFGGDYGPAMTGTLPDGENPLDTFYGNSGSNIFNNVSDRITGGLEIAGRESAAGRAVPSTQDMINEIVGQRDGRGNQPPQDPSSNEGASTDAMQASPLVRQMVRNDEERRRMAPHEGWSSAPRPSGRGYTSEFAKDPGAQFQHAYNPNRTIDPSRRLSSQQLRALTEPDEAYGRPGDASWASRENQLNTLRDSLGLYKRYHVDSITPEELQKLSTAAMEEGVDPSSLTPAQLVDAWNEVADAANAEITGWTPVQQQQQQQEEEPQ